MKADFNPFIAISSAELTYEQLHTAVRKHWGIENQLHWSLDVIFREDDAKIRKDNGPRNIALIRKIILNMLRGDKKVAQDLSQRATQDGRLGRS